MQYFWANYLVDEADGLDPYAPPLRSQDLSGLPPATVVGAQIAPLLTEGQQYADALADAGVPVRYRLYEGVTHEFFGAGAVIPDANTPVAFAAEGLREGFAGLPQTGGMSLVPERGGSQALLLAGLGLVAAVPVALAVRRRAARS